MLLALMASPRLAGGTPSSPAAPPELMNSGLNSVSVAPTTAASFLARCLALDAILFLACLSSLSKSRLLLLPRARRRAIFLRVSSSLHSTQISVTTTVTKYRMALMTTASTTLVMASLLRAW